MADADWMKEPPKPDELIQPRSMSWMDAPPSEEELNPAVPRVDDTSLSLAERIKAFNALPAEEKKKRFDELRSPSLATGARSALETITLGASEPVFGAMHAVDKAFKEGVDAAGKAVRGEDVNFDPIKTLKEGYREDIEQRKTDKSAHPTANVTGGIAGALVPAGPAAFVLDKAGGLIARGTGAAAEYVPAAVKALPGARAAGRVISGAAQGAGTALAFEAPRRGIERATGYEDKSATDLLDVGGVGALVGGGIPAVAETAKALAPAVRWAGKKALNVAFSVPEEHINYYLKNPQAVNGAKSITELKDKVDDLTENLRKSVEQGDMSVAEAKAHLKDIEQAAAQHRSSANLEFGITHTQVKQQFREAREGLEKAFSAEVQKLKDVKAPIDLADEAVQATRDLKAKVVKGSQEATSLIKDGNTIDLHEPFQILKRAKSSLNIAGMGPATPQAKKAAQEIDNLMLTIGQLPTKLSGREAKAIIKQIDQSEMAIYNSGEFTDDVGNAYKEIRRALDAQLKRQNPEYAKAMEKVAADRKLMEDVGGFQDKASAISRLNRIASPTSQVEREALASLGKATGRDFESPILTHLEAQTKVKDPRTMQRIKESLPEYKAAQTAERDVRMLEGPEAKNEYLKRSLQESGLPAKQAEAERALAQRQAELEAAQGKLEPFKNINPRNSQSTLERAMRATDSAEGQIQLKRQLDELSKMSDTDFVKALKDLRTKQAFEAGATRGSRNVNLFAFVFGGVGSLVGGAPGAAIGASAGAALGGAVDKFGPRIAKKMLDGVLKMEGSPTLQKIKALDLPPEAKAYLTSEYARFSQGRKVADGEPKKGKEKWAEDGFKKLLDHSEAKDKERLQSIKGALMDDPKLKDLLIKASDLRPGTKAMRSLASEIDKRMAGGE